jgi:hypothetical protein
VAQGPGQQCCRSPAIVLLGEKGHNRVLFPRLSCRVAMIPSARGHVCILHMTQRPALWVLPAAGHQQLPALQHCPHSELLGQGWWSVNLTAVREQRTNPPQKLALMDLLGQPYTHTQFFTNVSTKHTATPGWVRFPAKRWPMPLGFPITHARALEMTKSGARGERLAGSADTHGPGPQTADAAAFNQVKAPDTSFFRAVHLHVPSIHEVASMSCLNSSNPLLAGDSRMRGVTDHVTHWSGLNVSHRCLDTSTFFLGDKPLRLFGLTGLLKTAEAKDKLYTALRQGRKNLNSVAHDLANFYWTPVAAVKKFYSNATAPVAPKLYWLSMHLRPPLVPYEVLKRTQPQGFVSLHDVMWAAESRAAELLKSAGAIHIDLRPHTISSPPRWWDDWLHNRATFSNTFLSRSLKPNPVERRPQPSPSPPPRSPSSCCSALCWRRCSRTYSWRAWPCTLSPCCPT